MRKRLDQALVELGLAPTRSKAQQLIEAGDVEVLFGGEWRVQTQASLNVGEATGQIRVRGESEVLKYVSRGGLKLEGALEDFGINPTGWRCLDLGISTGGFSDCLLKHGAAEVCGVDVGHGQLHSSLQNRIIHFEGVNVKDIVHQPRIRAWISQGIDLCVADLSFISFLSLAPCLREFLPKGTKILALIKPQFELGAAALNKAGIVTDPSLYKGLEERTIREFPDGKFIPSRLSGQDGNREFFLFATL